MKRYNLPQKEYWSEICSRPILEQGELTSCVKSILDCVIQEEDEALYKYTAQFDGAKSKFFKGFQK